MAREHLYHLGAALQAVPVLGLEAFRRIPEGTGAPVDPTPTPYPNNPLAHDIKLPEIHANDPLVVASVGTVLLSIALGLLVIQNRRNREFMPRGGTTEKIMNELSEERREQRKQERKARKGDTLFGRLFRRR